MLSQYTTLNQNMIKMIDIKCINKIINGESKKTNISDIN